MLHQAKWEYPFIIPQQYEGMLKKQASLGGGGLKSPLLCYVVIRNHILLIFLFNHQGCIKS